MRRAVARHLARGIEPGGGPRGYLHQLRAAYGAGTSTGETTLDFRPVPVDESCAPDRLPGHRRLLEHAKLGIVRRTRGAGASRLAAAFTEAWRVERALFSYLTASAVSELLECDILFVHEIHLARRIVELKPREAREKVVVFTHSPTFYADQWAAYLSPEGREDVDLSCIRRARDEELSVMLAVRAVAWPCPEAADGYPAWQGAVQRGVAQPVYIGTGVRAPKPTQTVPALRDSWDIGRHQRVALFMGRAHPHKGFDRFVGWADHAASAGRAEWVFVHAGPAPKYYSRRFDALRAVGYVHDNAAAYMAADLVLMPNRHSYLDLGLLECLALGANVVTSPTGGHKSVLRTQAGVTSIPDGPPDRTWAGLQDLVEPVKASAEERRALWQRAYSPAPFLDGHLAAVKELLS